MSGLSDMVDAEYILVIKIQNFSLGFWKLCWGEIPAGKKSLSVVSEQARIRSRVNLR